MVLVNFKCEGCNNAFQHGDTLSKIENRLEGITYYYCQQCTDIPPEQLISIKNDLTKTATQFIVELVNKHGLKEEDILWIGNDESFLSWNEAKLSSTKMHYPAFIKNDIKIVFKDCWFEIANDCQECEYSYSLFLRKYPTKPLNNNLSIDDIISEE